MSALVNDKLTLYPNISFVINIGHDGSGTHSAVNEKFLVENLSKELILTDDKLIVNENIEARNYMEQYFKSLNKNIFFKFFVSLRNYFNRRSNDWRGER